MLVLLTRRFALERTCIRCRSAAADGSLRHGTGRGLPQLLRGEGHPGPTGKHPAPPGPQGRLAHGCHRWFQPDGVCQHPGLWHPERTANAQGTPRCPGGRRRRPVLGSPGSAVGWPRACSSWPTMTVTFVATSAKRVRPLTYPRGHDPVKRCLIARYYPIGRAATAVTTPKMALHQPIRRPVDS